MSLSPSGLVEIKGEPGADGMSGPTPQVAASPSNQANIPTSASSSSTTGQPGAAAPEPATSSHSMGSVAQQSASQSSSQSPSALNALGAPSPANVSQSQQQQQPQHSMSGVGLGPTGVGGGGLQQQQPQNSGPHLHGSSPQHAPPHQQHPGHLQQQQQHAAMVQQSMQQQQQMPGQPPQPPPLGHPQQPPPPHHQQQQIIPPNGPPPTKGSMSMDSQYMQQQSQIFVFTTQLANDAAEAVSSGRFPSVIAFHCTTPGTKSFLDQYPLKVQQFNRLNHSSWMNNMNAGKPGTKGFKPMNPSMMVNHQQFPGHPSSNMNGPPQQQQFPPFKQQMPHGGGNNPGGPFGGPCNPNNVNGGPQMNNWGPDGPWPPQNFPNQMGNQNLGPNHPQRFPGPPSVGGPMPPRPPGNNNNSAMLCPSSFNGPNSNFPNSSSMNPGFPPGSSCNPASNSLPSMPPAGTKIPDEELTPQQRQHREESLAKLRQLQQTLFHGEPGGDKSAATNNGPGGVGGPMIMPGGGPGQVNNQLGPCMLPSDDPSSLDSGNMCNPSMNCGPGMGPGNQPGASPNGPQDWMKMQQPPPFMGDDRIPRGGGGRKGSNSSVGNAPASSPSANVIPHSPSQMPGGPLPPPPYHQSGPRPMSSPHPASPATNSMPLPSPRMQSPADASRQQMQQGPHRGMPQPCPSPGQPGTPSADSNMSLNHGGGSISSPKPGGQNSSQALTTTNNTSGANGSRSRNVVTPSNNNPSATSDGNGNGGGIKKEKVHADVLASIRCKQEPGQQQQQQQQLNNSLASSLSNSCSSPITHIIKSEPQLMPVPSPQHIQYLNNFEAQELTIQKQPNTSLRESDLVPSDLDLNLGNDFPPSSFPSHFPPQNQQQDMRFGNPMMGMDGGPPPGHPHHMNQRFGGPGNNGGGPPPFDMNNMGGMRPQYMDGGPGGPGGAHRMHFDVGNQRMPGGPMENGGHFHPHHPHHRPGMPPNNYGGPSPMDGNSNNMMRCSPGHPNQDFVPSLRMRGPPPPDMGHRFLGPGGGPPPGQPGMMNNPNMGPRFGNHGPPMMNSSMMPMDHQHPNDMPFGGPPGMPPNSGETVSSTHLQSLQKMTPPFDIGSSSGGKMDLGNPMLGPPNIHGQSPHHGQHMQQQQQQQQQQQMGGPRQPFDPLSSMAAMGDNSPNNSGMNINMGMPGGPNAHNMAAMQVGGGPPGQGPNMVNFHTSLNSMHSVRQNQMNMGGNPNGGNMGPGGMHGQSPFGMNQSPTNMVGGPQTVNNTYVNANLSIQQLNIQNVTPPNYNPHMMPNQGGGMPGPPNNPNQMGDQNMSMMPPSMSPKLGQHNGPMGPGQRMPSPGPQSCSFPPGQSPGGPRGMGYPQPRGGSNGPPGQFGGGPNIQVKPNAPNTIQYLPSRPSMPSHQPQNKPPPNLDFLKDAGVLDKKVPTHNLQYFPNSGGGNGPPNGPPPPNFGGGTMNQQGPPTSGNMPMSVGPGRPQVRHDGMMMRGPPPGGHMGMGAGGPNSMMPNDMFIQRPQGPSPNGPGMMHHNGGPGDMMMGGGGMPPGGPMQQQQPNYMNPMGNDPNYDRQYQNFQQQLYATNTRGNGPPGNNCNNNQVHNNRFC